MALRHPVRLPELFGDIVGEQPRRGGKPLPGQLLKMIHRSVRQPGQALDGMVGQVQAALPAGLAADLEIAEHLLEGKLEGESDIMEKDASPQYSRNRFAASLAGFPSSP